MSDGQEVDLHIQSYPGEGKKSVTRRVTFGPESKAFALLIEVDPDTEELTITIGNGPANALIPTMIPMVLDNVAELLDNLEGNADFLEQLQTED